MAQAQAKTANERKSIVDGADDVCFYCWTAKQDTSIVDCERHGQRTGVYTLWIGIFVAVCERHLRWQWNDKLIFAFAFRINNSPTTWLVFGSSSEWNLVQWTTKAGIGASQLKSTQFSHRSSSATDRTNEWDTQSRIKWMSFVIKFYSLENCIVLHLICVHTMFSMHCHAFATTVPWYSMWQHFHRKENDDKIGVNMRQCHAISYCCDDFPFPSILSLSLSLSHPLCSLCRRLNSGETIYSLTKRR